VYYVVYSTIQIVACRVRDLLWRMSWPERNRVRNRPMAWGGWRRRQFAQPKLGNCGWNGWQIIAGRTYPIQWIGVLSNWLEVWDSMSCHPDAELDGLRGGLNSIGKFVRWSYSGTMTIEAGAVQSPNYSKRRGKLVSVIFELQGRRRSLKCSCVEAARWPATGVMNKP
jgi:hypothetical protein